MGLEQASNPLFAGHQTFHPRFGWIKKAYDGVIQDAEIFTNKDATVHLGVGRNMVDALKFWGTASHVITKNILPEAPRKIQFAPTVFGNVFFNNKTGWDPFVEDIATLWLLHWHMISPPTQLPVWWIVFNDFLAIEFTSNELYTFVTDEIDATSWRQPNHNSIKKDVDCLLRMYAPQALTGNSAIEDIIDSPFRELGIIDKTPGLSGTFRFALGDKVNLPSEVIAYTCLDFLAKSESDARTVSISKLLNEPGSPGRILKLTEDSLLKALEDITNNFNEIKISSPAGMPQIALKNDPAFVASQLMWTYYSKQNKRLTKNSTIIAGTSARKLIDFRFDKEHKIEAF